MIGPKTFAQIQLEGITEDRRRFPRGPRPTPTPVSARKAAQRRRAAGRKAAR